VLHYLNNLNYEDRRLKHSASGQEVRANAS
jgi:hypothetical protein